MRRLPWPAPRPEPYWIVILLFSLAAAILFLYHLATGNTPDPVAFSLGDFLDVYWYGLLITGGIALGAYVVAGLANERAVALWQAEVPPALRDRPLDSLALPEEIMTVLAANGVETVGRLLFLRGTEPEQLGLNRDGHEQVSAALLVHEEIAPEWVKRPPWRRWSPNHVWSGLLWCLALAIVGARLYHVLVPSPSAAFTPADYFRNPMQLINVRRGGLGIYGGIGGGGLGLALYTLRHRLPLLGWADLSVVGLALGQFIGRWGNFVNQELYGRPTDVPWAITVENRLPGYEAYSRFHPAFLYESLWNFLVFVVLLALLRRYSRRLLPGDLMALYLILYAAGRMLLETIRLDSNSVTLGNTGLALPTATLVSLVIALLMAGWMAVRHRRLRNGAAVG